MPPNVIAGAFELLDISRLGDGVDAVAGSLGKAGAMVEDLDHVLAHQIQHGFSVFACYLYAIARLRTDLRSWRAKRAAVVGSIVVPAPPSHDRPLFHPA